MKKILIISLLIANATYVISQGLSSLEESTNFLLTPNGSYLPQDEGYPIPRFAISVNPLGFIQFGPSINAEVGLTKSLVLNTHVRIAPLGLLTYVVTDWPEKITGLAYGGGIIYFFGEKRNKPYIGVIADYQKNKNTWENSEEIDKVFAFMFNGGYRFRFNSGFFINTGAYLGFGHSNWVWTGSYTEEGSEFVPAGLVEVTLGFEF